MRDKQFAIEVLRVQLKHRREMSFCSACMAIGVSLVVFAITFGLSVLTSNESMIVEWKSVMFTYMWVFVIVGATLTLISSISYFYIMNSEKKELEKLRREYLREW